MLRPINDALRRLPIPAVWLLGALPLIVLVWDVATGNMGVDPVQEVEHRLGQTAFYFLVAGLAVTPLLRLTGISLMRFRRPIGVICFAYAMIHVLAWVALDMGLLWGQMAGDIVKRPYLLFGMGAFLILAALAVTSNNLSIRRMGGQAWRRLHTLVYGGAILAAMHWLWAIKVNEVTPIIWAVVVGLLLASRLVIRRPMPWTRPARA